jgi:peroxiredoxin/Flp pilus assembly protein TadD
MLGAASAFGAPPSPQELLRRVYDRYAKMETYAERAAVTIEVMGTEAALEITYARRRPLAVYAASSAGLGMTIVSDGTRRWEYSARRKEYTEDRVAAFWPWEATDIQRVTMGAGVPGIGVPIRSPVTAHSLIAGRPFVDQFARLPPLAEQTLDDRPVWLVEIPLSAAYGLTAVHRLYVGREDLLVHRSEVQYRVAADQAGDKPLLLARVEHAEIQLDDAVAADRFNFDPPDGARRVGWIHFAGDSPKARAMVGKPAPTFEAQDLAGNKIALADFRGHPAVLFWWETWCLPCVRQIPSLERIYQLGRDQGLRVLGIDVGEKKEMVAGFVREHEMTFPVVIEKNRELARKYPYDATPFFVLIDPEGVIYDLGAGYQEPARLVAALEGIGLKLPTPWPREPAEQAGLHRLEALKAYLVGDDKAALAALHAATEAEPKAAEPWMWKGAYHLGRGELDQAKSAFQRVEQNHPQDAGARTEMARYYLAAGERSDEAVRLAKAAVRLAEGNLMAQAVLAEAHLANGEPGDAIKLLTSLEKQLPRDGGVKFLLGAAHEQKGDKEAALAAYRAARGGGYPAAAAAIARLEK